MKPIMKLKTERVTENWTLNCKMLSSEMPTCFDGYSKQTSNMRTKSALQCEYEWSASHLCKLQTQQGSTGLEGEDEKMQYSNF